MPLYIIDSLKAKLKVWTEKQCEKKNKFMKQKKFLRNNESIFTGNAK